MRLGWGARGGDDAASCGKMGGEIRAKFGDLGLRHMTSVQTAVVIRPRPERPESVAEGGGGVAMDGGGLPIAGGGLVAGGGSYEPAVER